MFFLLTSASHAILLAQIFVRFSCVWDDMYLNFVRYMKCICLPPLWAFVPRKRWIYCLSIKYGGSRFTSIVPIRFESIHLNFSVVIFGFLLLYLFRHYIAIVRAMPRTWNEKARFVGIQYQPWICYASHTTHFVALSRSLQGEKRCIWNSSSWF